jgi:methionine synthase II (cobalamin-independent)
LSQKLAQISSQQISATFSLDFTRGRNLDLIKTYGWNHDKRLGVGIIDARSIWQIRTDKVLPLLSEIKTLIPNISIQLSASLQFVPYDAKREKQLPEQLRNVLSFAEQKLQEVRFLARTIGGENSRIEQDLTVREFKVARSLTEKPVKGMLTGPVTMINWSYIRDDISRSEQAFQIALALREEVADLEAAGASMIQIDEPALREGLPLKYDRWNDYLSWAVDAFRLASAIAKPQTQIHTHMCYSEFGDIMSHIERLDVPTSMQRMGRIPTSIHSLDTKKKMSRLIQHKKETS